MISKATVRRVVPYTLLPLALLATALASALWLRSFPASVMAAPLFGACVISVLLPVVVSGLFTTRLWLTALIDFVALVLYLLLVVLRDPTGFGDLWAGLWHGPSQVLTFALPLVSPRSLLVTPVVLCWISGAVAGECFGRSWQSVLPYASWLVVFGLSYGATARAITSASDGRSIDTLVAAGLLLVLLLTRAAHSWVGQNELSEQTQADGVMPLRGFAIGAVVALALTAVTATIVQSSAFSGPPTTPQREPSIKQGQPLTPLSFVNDIRQQVLDGAPPHDVFRVRLSGPASGYFSIASVDAYDGDGWSFSRTFRPSGGVIPSDTDPALREGAAMVSQTYSVTGADMTATPWMPYIARPVRVTGATIDVDPASGMIVPATPLSVGLTYSVRSAIPSSTFDDLTPNDIAASSAPPSDRDVPGDLRGELNTVVSSFQNETGVPSSQPIPYLQAVAHDLEARYALSGGKATGSSSSAHASPSSAPSGSRSPAPSSAAPSSSSASPGARTGGTSFADVLTSILGATRAATPEQYATLVALIARQVGVPARVVSGFRLLSTNGSAQLPGGSYTVTDADAWTWVEAPIRGHGWVVLDAAPNTYSGQRAPASVPAGPSQSSTPSSAPNALVTSNNSGNAVAPPSRVPGSTAATTILVFVLFGLAALAVGIVAILLLRKIIRARRRRAVSDPRRRLLGAWHESLDVLVESGLPEVEAMTAAEITAATAAHFGEAPGQQTAYLGEAANSAIFNPTTWVSSAEADAAWTQHWMLRREVRHTLSLRDRFLSGVRYHHVRQRPARRKPRHARK